MFREGKERRGFLVRRAKKYSCAKKTLTSKSVSLKGHEGSFIGFFLPRPILLVYSGSLRVI